MCIKPPFTEINVERRYAILQSRSGEGLTMSYWDNPPQMWGVSQVNTNLVHVNL